MPPAPAPARPRTGCAKGSSPPGSRCTASRGPGCWTCTAGSGAVGLEALSRGADHALLVEPDAKAAKAIRDNIKAVGLPGADFRAGKAEQIVAAAPQGEPYDVVFLDPPYAVGHDDLREILLTLRANGWITDDALVTVERSTRSGAFPWPEGFEPLRSRKYGEGTLWYGRAAFTSEDS